VKSIYIGNIIVMFSLGCSTPGEPTRSIGPLPEDEPEASAELFTVPESIQPIIEKAEAGDADSQANLASLYYDGIGFERDNEKFIYWTRKAAEQNQPNAQYVLGLAYKRGFAVEQDEPQAREWLRKAAEQGELEAMEHLAELLVKSGAEKELEESMKWRREAAEQGLIQSQIELGLVYMHGLSGTEQDQQQGYEWLLKAAEQGDARAQHFLSVCYMNGDGVEKNIEKVKEWTTKAADGGFLQSQINMYVMLGEGEHFEKDEVRAVKYVELAARQNHAKSQYVISEHYYKGIGVEKNLSKAFFWSSVASDRREDAKTRASIISVDLSPKVILEQLEKVENFKKQFQRPQIKLTEESSDPLNLKKQSR
jgi:TPR repeat protein